jgi:hypothetical protein
MSQQLLLWAEAIEQSRIGLALAESTFAFPLIEAAHLLGLALSFGLLAIADLRLLSLLLRQVPAADVLRQLRPWIFSGFALTFITGGLLFWPRRRASSSTRPSSPRPC